MTKLSFRDSVLTLTLLPTIIIGVLLGSYFTLNRFVELEQIVEARGTSIVESLAVALEAPMMTKDKAQLHRLLSITQNKHGHLINSIAIFDTDNKLFLTSNFNSQFAHLKFPSNVSELLSTRSELHDKSIIVYSPITHFSQHVDLWQGPAPANLGALAIELSLDEARISQQRSVLASIAILVVTLLIAGILAIYFGQRFTRPLRRLLLATDKLTEGKHDIGIHDKMEGEFELLRLGLNSISDKMTLQKEEMQKHIDQATSDYRETLEQYEMQNIQLGIAKREAQDANKVKSDFLAKMSHELRTPLNGVIGFTRQLYKTPLNRHQKDYLDTIVLSANSLMSIISDILDFSKLEAGAMELENIQFQLRDVVNEVMTLLAPSAHEKQLELSVYINRKVPDNLIGDPTRFKQILINLINNAIKFTEKGSVKIDIGHRMLDDQRASLLVSVSDTGVGIAQEKQDTLFTPFGQADSSITRKFGGTGLGLIITKHLVEAMNGRITLNSAQGNGSCFTFNTIFELPNHLFNNDLPIKSLKHKRVLFFESHEHTHQAVAALLEEWEMQVTACIDEESFLAALQPEFNYDVCLIGHMASVDQMQTLKSYINKVRGQTDYLYLLLNTISHNMRESLIGSGADASLSKPVNHRKLCELLAAPYRLDHPDVGEANDDFDILPLKVLVADDNDANLKLITTLLNEQVESIDKAHNGSQAISLCKSHKYDIIFMDIQMPITDGITACKTILDASLNEDTPIIAVTAHALAGEKDDLLKMGFKGYLTKPIDEDMLRQTICDFSETVLRVSKVAKDAPKPSKAPFDSQLLDWEQALLHAGGKNDLALEMLNMLLLSVPETLKLINEAMDNKDSEHLLTIIHKFHGACCYTGVPKLKKLSETIETSLKQGLVITDLEPEIFELLDELENLLRDSGIEAA
ncbi:two-component sensor histidine kinase BarA [Pseudoalteromonas xiamenensis]|uniref:two-component sensor histidine kinase BarA n=1 Tax=Pseudoalteromonas xiamenensis TaxID=882626 RepID=UPI0035ED17A1